MGARHPTSEAYGGGAATGLVQSNGSSPDGTPGVRFVDGRERLENVVITNAESFYWWYHDEQCSSQT